MAGVLLIGLFIQADDPFFLVVLAVVVIGIARTGVGLLLDRRRAVAPA